MKRKQQQKNRKKTNSLSSTQFWFKPKKKKFEIRRSLNRYDFAYARRYKVSQVAKGAPGVTKASTNDINNIAEKRTNQIISEVGKVIDCVLPEIVRGTTEDVYQTPLRLLGEFSYLSFMT